MAWQMSEYDILMSTAWRLPKMLACQHDSAKRSSRVAPDHVFGEIAIQWSPRRFLALFIPTCITEARLILPWCRRTGTPV